MFLSTRNENVTPVVQTLKWQLEAQARQVFGTGIASSGTGSTSVSFDAAFEEDDIVVVIDILNEQSGDYYTIDSESASGFTFSVRNPSSSNAGNRVSRNVSWTAQGYGRAGS